MKNSDSHPTKKKKVWINIRNVIGNMSLNEHHSHSSNMKCHNLCTTSTPPTNMAKLLGLGRKCFLQSIKLNKSDFDNMITRFKYDIRVKYYVNEVLGENNQPIPKLYIKNNPNMPRATSTIEGALRRFEETLLQAFNSRKHINKNNITKLQENVLHYFRKNEEFIILLIDKNIGSCVINREEYLKQCIK